MARVKVGVLISGRGSNLGALIDAAKAPDYPAEIALVISNNPDAAGLARAAGAGIPTKIIDPQEFDDKARFDAALTQALEAAGVALVCLAGFMRVLSADFVRHWQDRAINIHPSLLPALPGLDTHARALSAGVKLHGCSVHVVREGVDEGPIIGQAAVPVLPGDTPEALAARVLAAEHRLYPACLRLLAEGRVKITGEVAEIDGANAVPATIFNPAP